MGRQDSRKGKTREYQTRIDDRVSEQVSLETKTDLEQFKNRRKEKDREGKSKEMSNVNLKEQQKPKILKINDCKLEPQRILERGRRIRRRID